MNDEIEFVENWVNAWCHRVTGMPLLPLGCDPTGTASQGAAHPVEDYQIRYIQLQDKPIHKDCGGDVVMEFDTRWENARSFTKRWHKCLKCRKVFDETPYE